MTTIKHSPVNQGKVNQVEVLLAQMLVESLQRGFHGKAAIELAIQDGTIQHIRRVVERIEK